MADQYIVKAGAAVARVAGSDRYLERGTILPEGVENLDHLKAVDLVAKVEADEAPAEDEGPKSLDDMKLDKLKAYAKEHGIELSGATKKADVLATIKAAEAKPAEGDGEGGPEQGSEPEQSGPADNE